MKPLKKPAKLTILIFLLLVVVFYLAVDLSNLHIFSCKTQPVIPNPPQFTDSLCSLGNSGLGIFSMMEVGGRNLITSLGYLEIILLLIVLPYIIACAITSLTAKTPKRLKK
jgi:hypothetical protein